MSGMFVVCHMLASLDGKIDGAFFGAAEAAPASRAYGELRKYYGCQATLYGTTTMLGGYADGKVGSLSSISTPLSQEDWVNVKGRDMGNFVVSVDPKGELAFSSHISEKKGREPAHIIEALTEQALQSTWLTCVKRAFPMYSPGKKPWTADCCSKSSTTVLALKG